MRRPVGQLSELALANAAVATGDWRGYFRHLRKAVKAGSAQAAENLGAWYLEGVADDKGVVLRRSPTRAVRLLRMAAEAGDPIAAFNLASCYDEGVGVKANPDIALVLYKKAAVGGVSMAAINAALCYRDKGNAEREKHWLTKAAALGEQSARVELAVWVLRHRTTRAKKRAALRTLRRLAKASDPEVAEDAKEALARSDLELGRG